ncbi:MAG: mechanosensitive ion channel family protein, partial [Gaiellaceae bacterium]
MTFWHRIVIAAVVFAAIWALERVIDLWLRHKTLPPEAVTRYRVLRRSISAAILVIGFFSALLVIPEVRALAGGLLASSAVLALVVGLASQQTLSNFVAGILIAITQPVRLGDRVTYGGVDGVVEEIGV